MTHPADQSSLHDAGIPFALVDVFGHAPLTGNPLAVVDLSDYSSPIPERWFPAVARELNQSETTFVLPGDAGATRILRSFTAGGVEVYGAGHNTLGAWWWLITTGRVSQSSDSAEITQRIGGKNLQVVVQADRLGIRQAPSRLGALADPTALAAAVGLTNQDLDPAIPARAVDTGARHLIVGITSQRALNAAQADKLQLVRVTSDVAAQGVYLVHLDRDADTATAHTRFFNPGVGLDEDPATGSAAGPLAAYLHDLGILGREETITIHQGEAMGRPSIITAVVGPDEVVTISGAGTILIEGLMVAPGTI